MKKKIKFVLWILFLLFILSLAVLYKLGYLSININFIVSYINSFGILSPLVYILIVALAIIISPIPSLPLAAASGLLFGLFYGTLFTLIGAQIGAMIAFLISKKLGREYIIRRFGKNISFIENIPENLLMFYIFIFRLFPFFQFDIISYGAGLTKISFFKFSVATFFGMIPMTIVFVYFGTSIFENIYVTLFLVIFLIVLMVIVPYYLNKYKFIK